MQCKDHCLTNLDFADDIALMTAKTEAMQHMSDNLQDVGESWTLG